MKTKHKITLVCTILEVAGVIVGAIIGGVLERKNPSFTLNHYGETIILKKEDIQNMAFENEELTKEITDYEKKVTNLENESKELAIKLGAANGQLDDVPTIQYQNCGLSIDGEEKIINTDKSLVLINGRRYYSKDFVDNLLPDNKSAIEKDNMLYIGKIVKEKSNLFDRQMIDKTSNDTKIKTNVKDTYGNIHNKAVIFEYKKDSITFNANKEYSKMKCILTVLDGEKGGGIIQIESEQGILYTSEEITSTTEPVEIDISINQASRITIKQLSDVWSYNMVTDAILYNEE